MPSPEEEDIQHGMSQLSLNVVDITNNLVETWSRSVRLPTVQDLMSHLQRPLEEAEKIPISQIDLDELSVPYSGDRLVNAITSQHLLTLFRLSADKRAPPIALRFISAIQFTPPSTGTEDRFHSTYDKNITEILEAILPGVEAIRNSNKDTSTALKRPDFGLLANGYCILRGEEKGTETGGEPEQELSRKIAHWEYDPLSFILGLS